MIYSTAAILQKSSDSTVLKLVNGHVEASSQNEARGFFIKQAMDEYEGYSVARVNVNLIEGARLKPSGYTSSD